MKLLISLYNLIIRFLTAFIPCKEVRKKLRQTKLLGQVCPKNNYFYRFNNGEKSVHKIIREGITVEIFGKNNVIEIDDSAIFHNAHLVIRGNNNLFKLGANVTACNARFFLYGNNKSIKIGNDCMFSYSVEIWSGDGHAIFNSKETKPCNYGQDVEIGDHVWIGAHSKILKGVKIAEGCIIGMQSLVTKDFLGSNSIIAGNPAKVIKKDIVWKREAPENVIEM